jgi:accessory colonization factor AcfC
MFCAFLSLSVLAQKDTLFIYGPGGPFAPINECAQVFGRHHNIKIKVTAGPEANWIEQAKKNADLIYGGAEYMLTQFEIKHNNLVNKSTRTELYKRGAAILIRPGNPKNIHTFDDLTKSGINILDINGAGQFGLWEDIAGKQNLIGGIQKNIKQSFVNTALGIAAWKSDSSYDAWITYYSWHVRLKDITQPVKIPTIINVYRGTPIALTTITKQAKLSSLFISYMKSATGHAVFKKWGWE